MLFRGLVLHIYEVNLKIQLRPELELTRVERSRRAAEIAAALAALAEGVDIGEKRRRRRFVKTVEQIETLGNQFKPGAFAEANRAGDAQIERRERMRHTAIASQVSRRENQIAACVAVELIAAKLSVGEPRTRNAERSVLKHIRSVGLRRLVAVRVNIRDDIKWTTRGEFDNRREREIGEKSFDEIAGRAKTFRCRQHAAEHEPVPLVKQRQSAFGAEISRVLRNQKRLQIRRIVN